MEIERPGYAETKKALSEKVVRAVEYYKSKYGVTPTLCFVNPSQLQAMEWLEGRQARPVGAVLTNQAGATAGETAAPAEARSAPRKKKMDVNA